MNESELERLATALEELTEIRRELIAWVEATDSGGDADLHAHILRKRGRRLRVEREAARWYQNPTPNDQESVDG